MRPIRWYIPLFFLTVGILWGEGNPIEHRSWETRNWTTADGLPDNLVTALCKTSEGYLWVATYQGLSRFDGQHFTRFHTNGGDALPQALAMPTALWVDEDDTMWIGSADGQIATYRSGFFQAFQLQSEWPKQLIIGFNKDRDGNLWLQDSFGNIVRLKDGYFMEVPEVSEDSPSNLALKKDMENGRLFALIRGVLWELGGEGAHRCQIDNPTVQGSIDFIADAKNGGMWIYRWNEVMLFQNGVITAHYPFDSKKIGGGASGMAELADGRLAISSAESGLQLFNPGRPEESQRISLEQDPWVVCWCEDREGTIWVGYSVSGLGCLTEVGYTTVVSPDHWDQRPVKSVMVDSNHQLWVGTEGAGLYRLQGENNWTHWGVESGMKNSYIWALAEDSMQQIWLGTWGDGIYLLRNGQPEKLKNWPSDMHSIAAIAAAPDGKMWVGSSRGLVSYREGIVEIYDQKQGLHSPNVRVVEVTPEGTVWFGMLGGGLGTVSTAGELKQFTEADGFPARSVGALYYDGDGRLWIGTYQDGLYCYVNGRFHGLNLTLGMPSNNIASIQEDVANGEFWFSSDKGVFSCSKSMLLSVIQGDPAYLKLSDTGVGLDTLNCVLGTRHCAERATDGTLYYATRNRIIIMPSDWKSPSTPVVKALVEGLWADGVELGNGAVLRSASHRDFVEIIPGYGRFELRFTVPSYLDPALIQCRYRLSGVDRDWTEAGSVRSVVYRNLSPGKYTFEVEAGTRFQKDQLLGESICFVIKPFWWQRRWVQVAAGTFLLFVVAGSMYAWMAWKAGQRRKVLERERMLEKERIRIARDLHDDLGANLTHISLLSDSTPPGASVEEYSEQIARIRETARESIRQMDEIVWAVNPRHDTLESLANYLAQYAQSYLSVAGIACRWDIPIELPQTTLGAEIRHNLFLSFKEVLNNIVKHSGADVVKIRLSIPSDILTVEIEDNGNGLWTDTVIPDPQRVASGSGLPGIRQRMREIGGNSKISNAPNGGVVVLLTLALRG